LFEKVNPYEIIEYIKNSIEILLNMKDDDMDELNEKITKVRQREKGQAKELRKLKQEMKK